MSIEINCNQNVDDIMRDVKEKSESVIYGGWHLIISTLNENDDPIIKFINLETLEISKLKELNKQLCGLYYTIGNTIEKTDVSETIYNRWRMARIVKLQKQVKKEIQKKENESRKLEDVYSKMSNDELKNELEALNEWKNHYETNLNEYEPNAQVHPTWVKNFEHALYDTKSKIDMINKILAYRELEESSMRGKKFNRYNNLTIEELDTLYGSLIFTLSFLSEDKYNNELKVIEKVLNMKRDE